MPQHKILLLTNPWHKYTQIDPTPTIMDLLVKREHEVYLTHLDSWILGTGQISLNCQQIFKINMKSLELKLGASQNKNLEDFSGLINYYFD